MPDWGLRSRPVILASIYMTRQQALNFDTLIVLEIYGVDVSLCIIIGNITIYYTHTLTRTPVLSGVILFFSLALALVHTSHMGTKRSTNSPSTPSMHSVSEDKDAMYTINHTKAIQSKT
jgi:hypothetical protein